MKSNKVLIEDLDDYSSQDLQGLRDQISLNNAQLIELVSQTDRFIFKIKQLNQSGINLMMTQQFKEGLIYLQQAQKILQYAASCGKTIDRSLIIATLQNQACIYQKLWQLQKSSNYMEAIIFNTNAYLQHPPPIIINSQITNSSSLSYINLSNLVRKRLQISFYYLQFSALSSQLDKHQVALGSAINALGMLKTLCKECYNFEKYLRKDEQNNQFGCRGILKQLSSVKQSVQLQKYDTYLIAARKQVKKLKKNMNFQRKISETLFQFVIGQVMQVSISSMASLQKQSNLKNQIILQQKIYKAIYISIAFFTIATQLRLMSVQNYTQEQKKQSKQYKKSQLYHLNAIIIAAKYIQYETQYLNHILKSYMAHYNVDLNLHFSQSQQTTNQTEPQSVGILLTPTKNTNPKKMRSIQNSPISPVKFMKYQSIHKSSQTQKTKVKIPLLHMKKKKKRKINLDSRQKSDLKTILKTVGNDIEKRTKRAQMTNSISKTIRNLYYPIDLIKVEKSISKWKPKSKKSASLSKSKRQNSRQFMIDKSKDFDKVQKKAKKCKDEYFGKPQKKKLKHKMNPSSSLSKTKIESPLSPYCNMTGKINGKILKSPII